VRTSRSAGLAVAALAVAAITALIFPLKQISTPESNGVLYLLAVLLVATLWGLRLGLFTALLSAAAFNFFHLPPVHRFTIADSGQWVALLTFLVAAVVASGVAELARSRALQAEQRRREAELAARLARILLGGTTVEAALPEAAAELGLAPDSIEPAGAAALEALLDVARERERLQSEVVETRALRRSDELKTALLRTMSHDLRTPLTAILTAGSALTEGELSQADRQELGRAIVEEAERLTALVEKLLDLSRLQAGAAEPRPDWVSIEELLREAASALDPSGARFSLAIDANLPLIRADGAQLERAFANLLENAARYSGAERVSVRARVVGDRLMVRVVDRGPGIAAAELSRIFEAFYRGVGGGGLPHTGSGLGLAIVKGFVEANGGRVWAESLPGQGTSFVVALPLEPATVP
jgi:two-component system, OmpR family, sensor histidine kinase KdpD